MNYFKKTIYSAIVFFLTLGMIAVGYGAYSALTPVNSGDQLTKNMWNQMVSNISDLDSRVSTLASSGSLWVSNGSNISYSAGNVGIGTTSPNKLLHIKTSAGNAELDIQSTTKNHWGIYHDDSSEDLRFWNSNNNIFTLQKNGNVGIGTILPAFKLDVNGSINTSGNVNGVNFYGNEYHGMQNNGSVYGFSNVGGDLSLQTQSIGRLFVSNAGNIGIGVSSPIQRLSIKGNNTAEPNSINNFLQYSALRLQTSIQAGVTKSIGIAGAPNGSISIQNVDGSDNVGDLLLNPYGGKIGIGTTTPGEALEVNGNLQFPSQGKSIKFNGFYGSPYLGDIGSIIANNTNYGLEVAAIDFFQNGGNVADIIFRLGAAGSSSEKVRITSGGNFGIGISNPAYKLQLGIDSAGKPNGGSWSNSSDYRLKKDIESITGALDKITKLRGVSFRWKNPEEHAGQTGLQGGFVAQEVEDIFPDWVREIDASGKDSELTSDGKIKSLTLPFEYDGYVIEAIKELKNQNEELRSEINLLKHVFINL